MTWSWKAWAGWRRSPTATPSSTRTSWSWTGAPCARWAATSLRWPGHSAFWKTLVDLRLLDEGSVLVDGHPVDRRRFLCASLEPQLQYGPGERDVAVLRVEARGLKDGRRTRVLTQCVDYRDLASGFTAMARTVGYTASIGAQLIGSGEMARRGLLSPVRDVPFEILAREMRRRGMQVTCTTGPWL